MRRVAAELDTGPASLYVYVANRDELCRAMLDRVAAGVPLEPADPARWREQVHRHMTAMCEAMAAHPGIAQVALANIPTGGNALRAAEALLATLRAGGIADQPAAWGCDILPLIATATVVEGDIYRARGGQTEEEDRPAGDRGVRLAPARALSQPVGLERGAHERRRGCSASPSRSTACSTAARRVAPVTGTSHGRHAVGRPVTPRVRARAMSRRVSVLLSALRLPGRARPRRRPRARPSPGRARLAARAAHARELLLRDGRPLRQRRHGQRPAAG